MLVGISKKDVFNSSTAKTFADAAKANVTGVLEGYATQEKEIADKETGEKRVKTITTLKIDGVLYAGESATVCDDVNTIDYLFKDEVEAGELRVGFKLCQGRREFVKLEVL